MEQIRSADVLANFPQVDEEKLNAALAAEAAASNRKIIVLDDDPTGVQTVHDIYVYTDWTVESLRKGFAAPEKLFFILTNSRGFTVAETTKAHREIAENTAKVAREFGMDYLIISRGDSTLRGHYPLETDLLREVTVTKWMPTFCAPTSARADALHWTTCIMCATAQSLCPAARPNLPRTRPLATTPATCANTLRKKPAAKSVQET